MARKDVLARKTKETQTGSLTEEQVGGLDDEFSSIYPVGEISSGRCLFNLTENHVTRADGGKPSA